ncbi:hypothetical protein ACVMIH_000053 [Bradyrhizobium sp. USDA 4503]
MSIILNAAATNNADWKTVFEFTDSDTGDLIDFTGATIEIDVKDYDGCRRICASTGNGKITITAPGTFELDVPASEMACLCPASYQIGGVYSLNGDTISLFTGSLAVVSGVARL